MNTPLAFRTHVSIFGNTNAGKSTLFNLLTGQNMMIVSEQPGTTTDPVTKALELLPYGPIALTDTAGLGDTSAIGEDRMAKTNQVLDRTDFALYTAAIPSFDAALYSQSKERFSQKKIGHLLVFTKCDQSPKKAKQLQAAYPNAVFVSSSDPHSIETLRQRLIQELSVRKPEERTMIGGLLPSGSAVFMVVPIDSEAPKGRLILPQVQFLRDCLDHGLKTTVVRDSELADTLASFPAPDLVVTDSQAFKKVAEIVPEPLLLTSFSMLMARMKGDLDALIAGCDAISQLEDGDKVLMAEACTHNSSHEDIGRVKIPRLLKKHTGKQLLFDYSIHHDFPENIQDYKLVIHCGGCMISSRSMNRRIDFCTENGVPITNYGVVLAYANGILPRCRKIFERRNEL